MPAPSRLFSGPLRGGHERPDWRTLPRPQVDTDDPAAGFLATIAAGDPQQLIAPAERRARAHRRGRAAPRRRADRGRRMGPGGGRAGRRRGGQSSGNGERSGTAAWPSSRAGARTWPARSFAAVYRSLPGELAPKLRARTRRASPRRHWSEAAGWYDIVSRTDPGVHRRHVRPGALPARGPASAPVRWRLTSGCRSPRAPTSRRRSRGSTAWPLRASGPLETGTANGNGRAGNCSWPATPSRRCPCGESSAPIWKPSCSRRRSSSSSTGRRSTTAGASLLGHRFLERDLRFAVERSYRELARFASRNSERIQLVDRANQVRPRTWI